MSYSMLMATTRNNCNGMVAATIFAMRALGIPVTHDYTPLYPYLVNMRHAWNAVRDSSGKYISFVGTESAPGDPHNGTDTQPKIYRRTFGVQNYITEDISAIPPIFRDSYFKDVSLEYQNFANVRASVNIPRPPGASSAQVYLAMLTADKRWAIGARGKPDKTDVLFPGVSCKVVYLPAYYVNDMLIPAGNPFRLDSVGKALFFETGTALHDTLSLSDIKLFNQRTVDIWRIRMLMGVFDGANKSDFSDATMLHTIKKLPDGFNYSRVKLNSADKFRYIRYTSHIGSYGNISEIGIYGADGKKLSGVPIGMRRPDSKDSELTDINNVFDEDLTTFYNDFGAWVGLDFGEPKQIGEIRYFPRTDNCEVFYWSGMGWQSVGKLNINNPKLKVPHRALLRLKDVMRTMIHEDRIFFLHNGFQEIHER
jgi:hypothetical protein